jgi:4-amino-4-deoxy-L-arabinose transferase-like glycosyltransferase
MRRQSALGDHGIGLALAAAYVVWLVVTSRTLGFARDEGFYFQASSEYAQWFKLLGEHFSAALERGNIDRFWAANHEHPSLMKSLFALSFVFLHEKWKVVEQASLAYRLPGMLMGGGALWLTHVFGARAYGRMAGLVAAGLLGLMPRVFYHAHLACFDIAIMTMWTLTVFVYWKSRVRGGLLWPLVAGVVYGLTLDTKHNAWILPPMLVVHALMVQLCCPTHKTGRGVITIPLSLVAMAIIGPLVFVGLWPWLWHDTLARFDWYASFHLNHDYYNMEFFGRNYFAAPSPRAYAPVMILATVPTITLLLFGLGTVERCRAALGRLRAAIRARWVEGQQGRCVAVAGDRAGTDLLLAMALAAAISPWLLSDKTPIFGGTKHWLPTYPFLCLFAGRGFALVQGWMDRTLSLRPHRWRWFARTALVAAMVAGPAAITKHSHPFGLTSYVPLVGGAPGAADLGLNRGFWGFTTQSANGFLSKQAPMGATVFIHDTAWQSWGPLIAEQRVRPDLRGVGSPSEAMYSLVHHELHMNEVDYNIWMAYGSPSPAYVVTHDGVPVVSVYERK